MKKFISAGIIFFAMVHNQICQAQNSPDGYWEGDAFHNNQRITIGFLMKFDTINKFSIHWSVPEYEWYVNLGHVEKSGDTLKFINGDYFMYHGDIIDGVLPSFLVSEYNIPFSARRGNKELVIKGISDGEKIKSKQSSYSLSAGSGQIWSGLSADKDILYFGTTTNEFIALDPFANEVKWRYTTTGANRGKALVTENIYFASDDGFVYCLSKQGNLIWKFDTGSGNVQRALPGEGNTLYDYYGAQPFLHEEILYVGDIMGQFFALNAIDGELIWKFTAKGAIRGQASVRDELVYFTSFDGNIYALSKETGILIWKFSTNQPITTSPMLGQDILIIGSRSCDLIGLDPETGKEKWRYYYWFSWVESTGIIHGDRLYIGSSDAQSIYCFDIHTGKNLWRTDVNGCSWLTPLIRDGSLFTGTVGNENYFVNHKANFVSIDVKTGKPDWQYTIKPTGKGYYGFSSSPVILGDVAWVATTEGMIYGFEIQ